MEFKGKVEAVAAAEIKVSGVTVVVDANTKIEGRGQAALAEITIGETVKVEGTLQANGSVVAREIKRSDDRVEFHGKVRSVNSTRVNVEGVEVVVDTRTRVRVDCNGASSVDIQTNQTVRVTGELQADGSVLAIEIDVSVNVSVEVTCRTERPRDGGDGDEDEDDDDDGDD